MAGLQTIAGKVSATDLPSTGIASWSAPDSPLRKDGIDRAGRGLGYGHGPLTGHDHRQMPEGRSLMQQRRRQGSIFYAWLFYFFIASNIRPLPLIRMNGWRRMDDDANGRRQPDGFDFSYQSKARTTTASSSRKDDRKTGSPPGARTIEYMIN